MRHATAEERIGRRRRFIRCAGDRAFGGGNTKFFKQFPGLVFVDIH